MIEMNLGKFPKENFPPRKIPSQKIHPGEFSLAA